MLVEYRAQASILTPETPTRRGPLIELTNVSAQRNRSEDLAPDCDKGNNKDLGSTDDGSDCEDATSVSSYAPSSIVTTDQYAHGATGSCKKISKADIRAQKRAKKSAKSMGKALKNQNRNLVSVTSAEITEVARILHGDEHDATSDGSAHPLATDKTIEDVITRNLSFVKHIEVHKAYLFKSIAMGRKETKERKRLKKRESRGDYAGDEVVEMDEVVSAIMIKLGVCPAVVAATAKPASTNSPSTPFKPTASSGRKRPGSRPLSLGTTGAIPVGKAIGVGNSRTLVVIATKLRAAIKTDLEKHENEVHMRYVRAGGFWRYVGKAVFERMTEFARKTDLATGESWEKKRAREGRMSSSGDVVDGDDDDADDDGDNEANAAEEEV